MNRRLPLAAIVVLLIVGTSAPLVAAAGTAGTGLGAHGATDTAATTNATTADSTANGSLPAGARLAGVVGSNGASLDGSLEARAFEARFGRANSEHAKAGVVASQQERLRDRLEELEAREAALARNRTAGERATGRYQARVAILAAELDHLQRLANATESRAETLPAQALDARGVNVTEIRRMADRAATLRGPDVAAIARNVTGAPGDRGGGPPEGVGSDGASRSGNDDRGSDAGRERASTRGGGGERGADGAENRSGGRGDDARRTGGQNRSAGSENGGRSAGTTADG